MTLVLRTDQVEALEFPDKTHIKNPRPRQASVAGSARRFRSFFIDSKKAGKNAPARRRLVIE